MEANSASGRCAGRPERIARGPGRPGRMDGGPGRCPERAGCIGGRGEEVATGDIHPSLDPTWKHNYLFINFFLHLVFSLKQYASDLIEELS